MTESNSYDYQEIVLVVYVLSNDILLKPIRPLVERIEWPIIDGGRQLNFYSNYSAAHDTTSVLRTVVELDLHSTTSAGI